MEEKLKNTTEVCMKTYDNYTLFENERIENDMIYCTICGDKKLCSINDRRFRIICSCEQKRKDEEKQRQKQEEYMQRFKTLKEMSLLGKRYSNCKFENTNLDNADNSFIVAFNRCQAYCEKAHLVYNEGYGIYLYGDSGGGKTHLMACMINRLSKDLQPCLITNFFDIMKAIKETYHSFTGESEAKLLAKLCEIPFLFIDDLGTENLVAYGEDKAVQEKIYDIINRRYAEKLPTIFSSNLSPKQLVEKGLWQKTVDRIVEMCPAVMYVKTSQSYRLKNRKKTLPF